MALQSPFFNNNTRRDGAATDVQPATPATRVPGSGASLTAAQPAVPAAIAGTPAAAAAASDAPAAPVSESRLTVGPNIKLKGVEITDCDTLVVDGSVEATMDSRLMQISERGAFKGTAEIDIAEIRGHFDGNLTVRDKLTIFATGKVTGQIRYGKIVMEEGAQICGDIQSGATMRSAASPKLQQVG
jgi:cytoskeletal protein CcmA (bactofilin family)